MTLAVDLFLLETWQRFEEFCFHLARTTYSETGTVVRLGLGGDGGRDVVVLLHADGAGARTIVLQCKFTHSCGADTKRAILGSLNALGSRMPDKHILCMPVDLDDRFLDWFVGEMRQREMAYGIWGRAELLARLAKHQDILHLFFQRVFAELQEAFVTDQLELQRLALDPACSWTQSDPNVLLFASSDTVSPDLVLDLIVRNRGTLEACLTKLDVRVLHETPVPHGIAPPGLLLSKFGYSVSVGGGRVGA